MQRTAEKLCTKRIYKRFFLFIKIAPINRKIKQNNDRKEKEKEKGVKSKADKDSADTNPLLYIYDKRGFMMECGNLLQDNDMFIFHGYECFDIKKDKEHSGSPLQGYDSHWNAYKSKDGWYIDIVFDDNYLVIKVQNHIYLMKCVIMF